MIGALLALALLLAGSPAAVDGALDCAPVRGVAPLLEQRLVLVGELHGTEESPRFVAALVCRALAAGRSVTLGLEWVPSEGDRVEAYLGSDGGPEARQALLAGEIWQARGQAQYGATSEAMLGLLERARTWRQGGRPVEVLLFNRYGGGAEERDRLMAEALGEAIGRSSSDFFVVLTGNIHSRLSPGTRWNPDFEPMGYHIRRAHPDWRLLSLDVAHAGGTAWLCISGEPCGPRRQPPRGEAGEHGGFEVRLAEAIQPHGHHGTYFVGPIHASPPAVPDPPGP